MLALTVQSPAKLNLDLRVLSRYGDGYHKLFTLFHRISLKDKLRLVKRRRGFTLYCRHPAIPTDERNLIFQAYQLLKKRHPHLGGVSVYLEKKIPLAAGLGGGSSNAASFLLGMKTLYRLPDTKQELLALGKRLGADIPFFLHNVSQALATGRGDRIQDGIKIDRKWFVLIVFDRGLSTKKVYQNLPKPPRGASLTNLKRIVRIACRLLNQRDLAGVDQLLKNDLQRPAMRLRPDIRRVSAKASKLGASLVRMSGSGPTVFTVFSDPKAAKRFASRFKNSLKKERIILCHSF